MGRRGAFAAAEMRQLLHSAALAVGTEEELAAATATTDVARGVAAVLDCGVEALIPSAARGDPRCFARTCHQRCVAPFPIEVLNVLGAGDAFASGFLYGYLQGWPLERAARMGNATGAIVVTRHGCANFMPTLDEVTAFVSARGEDAI
jgi:5-dehydro-2-deoxygluconokinase